MGTRLDFAVRLGVTVAAALSFTSALADDVTGERQLGQSILEPGYNDLDGSLKFLLTPMNAPEKRTSPTAPNFQHAVSPLYVVVYPTSVASTVGTLNCEHLPMDNCPDHGPLIASLAAATVPAVYGNDAQCGSGVQGHDHLFDAPPAPQGDFNVSWEPVVVLFTSPEFASNHITTEAELEAALDAHQVIEIPLPPATFQCAVVPGVLYDHGTDVAAATCSP